MRKKKSDWVRTVKQGIAQYWIFDPDFTDEDQMKDLKVVLVGLHKTWELSFQEEKP